MSTLTITRRHQGPPGSANGGYTAGILADHVVPADAVTVTLRLPPPLDTPMALRGDGSGGVRLLEGEALVAEAVPSRLDVEVIDPVSYDDAVRAAKGYAGLADHPFPGCFVCGTARSADDALCLRPGRVASRDVVATPWVPPVWVHEHADEAADVDEALEGAVAPEHVWAALDCPGGWAVDIPGRPMVLGRMTARIDALPQVGSPYVVAGWVLGEEGRKAFVGSALFDSDGRVLASARAVWIAVDPAQAGRPTRRS